MADLKPKVLSPRNKRYCITAIIVILCSIVLAWTGYPRIGECLVVFSLGLVSGILVEYYRDD